MKLFKNACTYLVAGILATGCSSPVQIQKDDSVNLATYRTYTWVDTRKNENDNSSRASQFADITVRNAANNVLSNNGWKEVSTNPDILLSYDILVERSTQRQSDPVYSQPFTRMYYNPYIGRWRTLYYPSRLVGYDTYETPVREGTVTISMVDAKTDRPVWQGWTTERLDRARPSTEEISSAVNRIFKKLDISK